MRRARTGALAGLCVALLLNVRGAEEPRIGRFPWFYRGGVSFVYASVPKEETEDFSRMLMNRERPDPVAVVPADREQADRLRAHGLEVAEREGDTFRLRDGKNVLARIQTGGKVTGLIPNEKLDLLKLPALRVESLTPGLVEELCKQAIKERSWILVVVDRPGPEEKKAVDRLHDFHTQLWNGTPGYYARSVAQSRAAEVAVDDMTEDGFDAAYTDKSDLETKVPLSLQVYPPGDWELAKTDGGQWTTVKAGRVRWEMRPGTMKVRRAD